MLSLIREKHGDNVALYCDDGLAAFNATPQEVEKTKKCLCKIFRDNGLKITVEATLGKVNFLDVTLDLLKSSFAHYTKPNNTTVYVHAQSNHPPSIIKNIPPPPSINKRLSELSSNEAEFNNAKPPYQEALKNSGYDHELKYLQENEKHGKKSRKRNIVWYNPPFSSNVQTNVGKSFIKIVRQCFPASHPLRKIFNTNTLKLSYSCLPNVGNIIDGHNKKTRESNSKKEMQEHQLKTCNCRKANQCPLNGKCLTKSVIYKASVTTRDGNEEARTYIGFTKNEFKERFNGHKHSFSNKSKRQNTELSKHIWELKDQQKDFNIEWEIPCEAKSYDNRSKRCQLYTMEKFYIIYKSELGTLNKRNELASGCRHKAAFLYKNCKF